MQGLIDAAVVIVAMVVPPLVFRCLQKASHRSRPCSGWSVETRKLDIEPAATRAAVMRRPVIMVGPRERQPTGGVPRRSSRAASSTTLAKRMSEKWPEGRHGPALDQAHVAVPRHPARVALPGKLRPPAEPRRCGREPLLQHPPQPCFRADAADQHDLAAGLQHAGKFVERRFRAWDRGDDSTVRPPHRTNSSGNVRFSASITASPSTLCRPRVSMRSCALRSIGSEMSTPNRRLLPAVLGQRDAGADANLEDPAADALGRHDGGAATVLEHGAKHQIVDRGPAGIGVHDRRPCRAQARRPSPAPLLRRPTCLVLLQMNDPRAGASTVIAVRGLPMATCLRWPMNCRALFSQERVSANSR